MGYVLECSQVWIMKLEHRKKLEQRLYSFFLIAGCCY